MKSFFRKISDGFRKTREVVNEGIQQVLQQHTEIDPDLYDDLEAVLLRGDVGPATTAEILDRLKRRVREEKIVNPRDLRAALRGIVEEILRGAPDGAIPTPSQARPVGSSIPEPVDPATPRPQAAKQAPHGMAERQAPPASDSPPAPPAPPASDRMSAPQTPQASDRTSVPQEPSRERGADATLEKQKERKSRWWPFRRGESGPESPASDREGTTPEAPLPDLSAAPPYSRQSPPHEQAPQEPAPDPRATASALSPQSPQSAQSPPSPLPQDVGPVAEPRVILVVGVNGVGKTTSLAKLAYRAQQNGETPLIVASDTFRAAASEQLEVWAKRLGVDVVRSQSGADPSAVAFDGIRAARSRGVGVVLIDTAGRLQTKGNLMEELKKIHRVCGKALVGAPHETLLVLDATIGQNALSQARLFSDTIPIDGLLLAKLDGTSKGGVILAITHELSIPVRYAGVGEKAEDLIDFDPAVFAEGLVGEVAEEPAEA